MVDVNITFLSDTHGHQEDLDILDPCDILIFGGDMSNFGSEEEVSNFFKWFNNQPTLHRVLVAGNHDICFDQNINERPSWLQDILTEYQSKDCNFYLENSGCEIWGNINIWGTPYSKCIKPTRWAFNVCEGPEAHVLYSKIPENTDILINHGPAYGKLDFVPRDKEFYGSESLLWHIKRVKPTYVLCGHVHEGYGMEEGSHMLNYTTFYNGSIMDNMFNPTNKPIKINYDL